ncbi:hypothetical protein [Dactylosporangium sp. NPDC048998]|uniref:hypothetical protein n=1 Tax=Dactylosporangium sp. NPDC048998 TaxID=3363976 RepID=UPI0037165376
MRWRLAAAAALALLAGCARGVEGPAAPAEVHDAWTSCRQQVGDPSPFSPAEPLKLPRLPRDFVPAAVVVCSVEPQQRADGGEDLVLAERRGTDVGALTEALRLPDQPMTAVSCTADLPGVPWFAVFDADGRWLRPGIARDVCGKLRIEAREAVRTLRLTVVATTVLRETVSSAAAASGCAQGWSDMVSVEAAEPSRNVAPFDPPKSEMRLCLYRVPPAEQGSAKPAGDFERGGVLPAQRWTELRQAMLGAGAPSACTAHASRFALLRPTDDTSGEVYVELDGCHRVLLTPGSGGAALRQGDTALADRIDKAL